MIDSGTTSTTATSSPATSPRSPFIVRSSVSSNDQHYNVPHTFSSSTALSGVCNCCKKEIFVTLMKCKVCGITVHTKCVKDVIESCRAISDVLVWNFKEDQKGLKKFVLSQISEKNCFVKIFFTHIEKTAIAINDKMEGLVLVIPDKNINQLVEHQLSKLWAPLDSRKISQVSAGASHTLFLTQNGHVYSLGRNLEGQLGLGQDVTSVSVPTIISDLLGKVVSNISSGSKHCLANTVTSEVYSWGYGKDGRLGTGNEQNCYQPATVQVWKDSSEVSVTSIVCGWSSSALVISPSFLYTFGKGVHGGIGHGIEQNEKTPRLVEGLFGQKLVDIASGYYHTVVVTNLGQVYSFGYNAEGQCGTGDTKPCLKPTLVSYLSKVKVKCVSASQFHTFAITDKGDVYFWGTAGSCVSYVPLQLDVTQKNILSVTSGILDAVIVTRHKVTKQEKRASVRTTPNVPVDTGPKAIVRKGLSGSSRSEMWLKLSSAADFIVQNPNYYKNKLQAVFGKDDPAECQVLFEAVQPYVPDDFSFMEHKHLSDKQIESVKRILYIVCKRDDTGILYAKSILPDLVCLLLAYLSEEQVYIVIVRLLEGKLKIFQNFDSSLLSPTFISLLQNHAPSVFDHIEKLRVSHSSFEDWFSRLFTSFFVDQQIVFRIVDNFLLSGLKVLFQVAIAVFKVNSPALLKTRHSADFLEVLPKSGKKLVATARECDSLFSLAFEIKLKAQILQESLKVVRDIMLPSEVDTWSSIVNRDQFSTIFSWLPSRFKLKTLQRLYFTQKNGFNLNTLVLKCGKHEPTLLIIKSSSLSIFGAFVTGTWERNLYEQRASYKGTGEMFLFTLSPLVKKYHWTKANNFFMMIENRSFMIGGGSEGNGSGCALWLDDELHRGFSDLSPTFDNMPLNGNVNETEFQCIELEVFGFKDPAK